MERGRQAVAAVFRRRPAQAPERVLQAAGQGGEAFAAQHHLGMGPAGEGQPEVIEPMVQRLAGDVDAQAAGVGEVRQALEARRVVLAEDDIALRPMLRLPMPHPPFQRAADAVRQAGVAALHFLEQGDRPQPGHGGQHRHHLRLPDRRQRIRPAAATWQYLLRGQPRISLQPAAGAGAEAGTGSRAVLGHRST